MTFKKYAPAIIALLLLIAGLLWRNNFFHQQDEVVNAPKANSETPIATITPTPANTPQEKLETPEVLSEITQKQVSVLKEILASHNDNDPRMDRELKVLSAETKAIFRKIYKDIPAEKRNDRGTIVFLLGRNLSEPEDFDFINEVLNEPRCLSLADCNRIEVGGLSKEHDEHQGGFNVSLAYPQLVSLHSLANFLKEKTNGPLSEAAKNIIAQATHSNIPEVAQMADNIQKQISK